MICAMWWEATWKWDNWLVYGHWGQSWKPRYMFLFLNPRILIVLLWFVLFHYFMMMTLANDGNDIICWKECIGIIDWSIFIELMLWLGVSSCLFNVQIFGLLQYSHYDAEFLLEILMYGIKMHKCISSWELCHVYENSFKEWDMLK